MFITQNHGHHYIRVVVISAQQGHLVKIAVRMSATTVMDDGGAKKSIQSVDPIFCRHPSFIMSQTRKYLSMHHISVHHENS